MTLRINAEGDGKNDYEWSLTTFIVTQPYPDGSNARLCCYGGISLLACMLEREELILKSDGHNEGAILVMRWYEDSG